MKSKLTVALLLSGSLVYGQQQTKTLTTNAGAPVADNQDSLTAGENGPVLLQDLHLIDKLQSFDRERIPERVVHARGVGAHGVFVSYGDQSQFTKAAFLNQKGKETPVFVRFSTVMPATGSPEQGTRDPLASRQSSTPSRVTTISSASTSRSSLSAMRSSSRILSMR